jgi:hypothetical protein
MQLDNTPELLDLIVLRRLSIRLDLHALANGGMPVSVVTPPDPAESIAECLQQRLELSKAQQLASEKFGMEFGDLGHAASIHLRMRGLFAVGISSLGDRNQNVCM